MKSFPNPSRQEEKVLCAEKYTEGDLEAKHILIERNLRLVAHIVKNISLAGGNGRSSVYWNNRTCRKAIVTFDPEKSARLATYAARCIENELLMHFRGKKKSSKEVFV